MLQPGPVAGEHGRQHGRVFIVDPKELRQAHVTRIGGEIDQARACGLFDEMQPAPQVACTAGCDHGESLRIDAAERANALLVKVRARVPHAGVKVALFRMQTRALHELRYCRRGAERVARPERRA